MTINGTPYIPSLTPDAIAERQTWQYRALAYTHAGQSQLGALIVALLGRQKKPPCFHPAGIKITVEGHVEILYDNGHGLGWQATVLYDNVQAFTDVFRGLADAIKCTDAEREAMFSELRKFIKKDERAVSNLF